MIDAKEILDKPFCSDPLNILYVATKPYLKDMFPDKEEKDVLWSDISKYMLAANSSYKFPVKFKNTGTLDDVRKEILTDFGLVKVLLLESVVLCKDQETQAFIKLKYL